MGFSYEEAMDRLECPHINCDYYEVITEISGSYVEDKLTLEKSCRNCEGRDHLMFEVGSYNTSIDEAEVGQKFNVNSRAGIARASEGDTLTVTAIAENPRAMDNPVYGGDDLIISVARNLDTESSYYTGTLNHSRFKKLLDNGKIEPSDN